MRAVYFSLPFVALGVSAIAQVASPSGPTAQACVSVVPGERLPSDAQVTVIGAPSGEARRWAVLGCRAIAAVAASWDRPWQTQLVLRLAGSTPDSQSSDIAASAAETGQISVNPAAFARLSEQGRQMVITHEVTHVAVHRSLPGALPSWVSEGHADLLGYKGSRMPPGQIGAPLLKQLGPQNLIQLPKTADFGAANPRLRFAYLSAWSAMHYIHDRVGMAGVNRFVHACADHMKNQPETQCATTLSEVLSEPESEFTKNWNEHIRSLH